MARPRWLIRRTVFACSLAFLPPAICIAQQKSDSELFAETRDLCRDSKEEFRN